MHENVKLWQDRHLETYINRVGLLPNITAEKERFFV
jgi:hypothetical protein